MLDKEKKQKGQSIIELIVAMAIFVLVVSAISFLVLDSYISHRLGKEVTIATFLAQEGLEAARSIRDNNWDDLVDGEHGIVVSGDNWAFQGSEDDVSDQLLDGKRKIIIRAIDPDRKKVQCEVKWNFSKNRPQGVTLTTYLTNWQKETTGVVSVFFSSSDYSVREDEEKLSVYVFLSTTSQKAISVDYETIDGTAVSPDDYISTSGTLLFRPGEISRNFSIEIVDDSNEEENETFFIELSNPKNAVLGDPSQATTTIIDNDGGGGCWGTGGSCDPECRYSNYGLLVDYFLDPGCSDSCPSAGSFYVNPSEGCSDDGSGTCYKMENPSTQYTSCTQDGSCEGECQGTCTPCSELSIWQCRNQRGCRLSWTIPPRCIGTCAPCERFPDSDSCGLQENDPQYGCSWQDTKWFWNLQDSKQGYSSYTNCQWYTW